MNASQDNREKEKQAAITVNIKNMNEKITAGKRFVINSGCALEVLEDILNAVPSNYVLRDVFIQQMQVQASKLQIPKREAQIVTFYYPLLERVIKTIPLPSRFDNGRPPGM